MNYHGIFRDAGTIIQEFEAPANALDDAEVLVAWYEYESYEGDAYVLYRKYKTLYEVHGSHCSCYGLEGQWKPERTTKEYLRQMSQNTSCYSLFNRLPSSAQEQILQAAE